MNTSKHFSPVDCLAIAWLLLPMLLFLTGWIVPVLAYPLALLLCGSLLWLLWKSINSDADKQLFRGRWKHCLAAAVMLAILVFLSGINGHWSQHTDFGVRNDIFIDLCRQPWPPRLEDGRYFIYYFQSWLPAAFLGKYLSWPLTQWVYYFWSCLGVFLVMYYVFKAAGKASVWLAALFVMWNGAEFLPGCFLAYLRYGSGWAQSIICANHVMEPFVTFGPCFSVCSIIHCFLPIAMVCGMSLQEPLLKRLGPFLGAVALCYSPMGAIFFLPCLLFLYFRAFLPLRGFFAWENWQEMLKSVLSPFSLCSIVYVFLVLLPFYGSALPTASFHGERLCYASLWPLLLFYLFFNVGLAAMLIRWKCKDAFLWLLLAVQAGCMLGSVCYHTDIAMKGSAIANFYLLVMFARSYLAQTGKKQRIPYIAYLALTASYLLPMTGAASALFLGLSLFFLLQLKWRYQLLCAVLLFPAMCYLLLNPPNYIAQRLNGSLTCYNPHIGIYQPDGGSGKWWWYRSFPDKEDMPRWFKR